MVEESHLCNLITKYLLFVVNVFIWILGGGLLGVGIIAELQSEDYGDVSATVLNSPAIACMVIGSFLFLLGLLGCIGALIEFYWALVIYAVLLSAVLLAEIGIVVFVFLRRDESEELVRETMTDAIIQYRDNPDLQTLIDNIQSELLECCGVNNPDDWQLNVYFNCCSLSVQRCSVPFSCCRPDNSTTVVNTQCGMGALLPENTAARDDKLYNVGCYEQFEDLLMRFLPTLAGIGIAVIVLEIINIFLSIGLAIDINREKKEAKAWREQHPKQPKSRRNYGDTKL